MSYAPFVHLHVHSGYSLLTSTVRLEAVIQRAKSRKMPALALTDQGNLFAAIPFFTGCIKAGIKPILGAQVYVVPNRHERPNRPDQEIKDQLILLCRNQEGWQNLMRLVSKGHLEGSHDKPRIDPELLRLYHKGIIALSAGHKGQIARLLKTGVEDQAKKVAMQLRDLFQEEEGGPPGFYIELQRHGITDEEVINQEMIRLAYDLNIPLVASNDIHFLDKKDHRAHDALVCIGLGLTLFEEKRPKFTQLHDFTDPQEMVDRFSDIPEAIENTLIIAERCNLQLELGKTVLPDYKPPEGESLASWLKREAEEGLKIRLEGEPESVFDEYRERLIYELDVILQMGFPGYFLIVSDFIRWAKSKKIPVGPGRGSGAGSVVAWALDITDLDPIRYELLFERFLNPERVSMPDFDVDFCMDRREKVIHYVQDKYGHDRVAQIITFGTLQARAVIRDVGRVLEFPYGRVDRIAKLVPNILGITLKEAIKQEERFKQLMSDEPEVTELIELALSLEGIPRSAGTHAAGVVMANGPLTDMVPLYRDPRSDMPVTQFNMGDVEKAGLVKFDFLGLKTLTVIDDVLELVNKKRVDSGEKPVDINKIDLKDKKTFDLLKVGQTRGVFQLESSGMREILKKLAPDTFEEIVALVALYRPGPLGSGMVDDFIECKHGRKIVSYPLPQLEPILKETYGVILYQEQVMKIAQVLAGYTLGGADLLRRAMGKKKVSEMASQREIFTNGALATNISEERATYIFDLMEKFAGYGFNKSHSAAYALISYQTAWLKAHYPVEFMTATLTCDMLNTDKVALFIRECRDLNIPVIPPHVNQSQAIFSVEGDSIRYGMAAVKNVGESVVEALMESRKKNGLFTTLFDLTQRASGLNKRMLENLIKAGACDFMATNRATLLYGLPSAMSRGSKKQESLDLGFMDMFADSEEDTLEERPDLTEQQKLSFEKEALGFYSTGHPMDQFSEELAGYGLNSILQLKNSSIQKDRERSVQIAGMVAARKMHRTKKGDRMAFLTLEDNETQIEVTVFSEVYNHSHLLFEGEQMVLVSGQLDTSGDELKITADEVMDLDSFRQKVCKSIHIKSNPLLLTDEVLDQLQHILENHSNGSCQVIMDMNFPQASVSLCLGKSFWIRPNQSLLDDIKRLFGPKSASFHSRKHNPGTV